MTQPVQRSASAEVYRYVVREQKIVELPEGTLDDFCRQLLEEIKEVVSQGAAITRQKSSKPEAIFVVTGTSLSIQNVSTAVQEVLSLKGNQVLRGLRRYTSLVTDGIELKIALTQPRSLSSASIFDRKAP